MTEKTQSFQKICRSPTRRRRLSLAVAVDEHLDREFGQWLLTEFERPPQLGVADVDRPLQFVAAARDDRSLLVDDVAVPPGDHDDLVVRIAVERRREDDVRALLVGVAAQHAEPVDAHRAGVEHPHRAPQATGVPAVGEPVPALQDAGDVRPDVVLRRAGDLDGEDVLVADPGQLRDVERVREEVALRVAEIRTVQPGVTLIEDAVERDPASVALVRRSAP